MKTPWRLNNGSSADGRLRVRPIIGLVVVGVAIWLGAVGSAQAQPGPGWELSGTTYPSNLVPGVDQVTEVVADEGAGTFTLGFEEEHTSSIPFAASASVVQAELEALPAVGAGNVTVTAGAEAGHFEIALGGTLGSLKAPEFEAEGATTTVTTEGSSSGTIEVAVFNVGAGASSGPITVTDTLPVGLEAKEAGGLAVGGAGEFGEEHWGIDPNITQRYWICTGNGPGPEPSVQGATVVTCHNNPEHLAVFQGGGGLPIAEGSNPQPQVGIAVEATAASAVLTNRATISGGGAPNPASTSNTVTVGPAPARVGVTGADVWFSNEDGTIDTQAGSHPYAMTTVLNFGTGLNGRKEGVFPEGEIRDLETELPPGVIGNLASVPQCTRTQVEDLESGACPVASMVGMVRGRTLPGAELVHGVFNILPPPGDPAELGFKFLGVTVFIDFTVRSGGDYGITAHVNNLAQREAVQAMLSIWGVPGDHSHDRWRSGKNGGCSQEQMEHAPTPNEHEHPVESYCTTPQFPVVTPILTLPTACNGPQPFISRQLSGWQVPGAKSEASLVSHDAGDDPAGFTGCENLSFGPSFEAVPDTARADTPTGLTAAVTPTLGGLNETTTLGSADISTATVALPQGFVVNPGQAQGLQFCSLAQAALEPLPGGEENDDPASCPAASKVGTAIAKSPLLEGAAEKQFEGNVYVLPSNPPELKLLIAASADGVNLKLVGTAHLDQSTGQITTTFENTPQVPASLFKLTFESGARAALDTPASCGTYTSNAVFSSWASPAIGPFATTALIGVTEGAGGSPCPGGSLPFSPTLTAGTTSTQAGGFTGLSTSLERGDGQQRLEKLQVTLPRGLAGMISNVQPCPEPQASQGTCSASSQVGHAIVTSGPGANPLVLPQPGQPPIPIYLTGPYQGAPFGLTIVTPVVAGPFNLGTIVTRARINIDPETAQVTVTTDPFPQIVDGVPTDIRSVYADIDKQNFSFGPTSCNEMAFTGSASGAAAPGFGGGGATATLASRFEAGSCRELQFKPKFSASTAGKTSKAGGASLNVKLAFPSPSGSAAAPGSGPGSGEANVAHVKVELPKALPSRLTTLQKACTEAAFAANPASCPAESIVGHAIAHTPILKSPLEGPAYFVSHGGAAFPELVLVLQGEGVTIELHGNTDIKNGITSSTFNQVPDAPVSSFELKLPQGAFSALAAPGGNLCGQKLIMPTVMTGQNGAQIKQSTLIGVEGCPNAVSITSKKLRGRKLTLSVVVPGAGRLSASGRGLKGAAKSSAGRETLTLTLLQKKAGKLRAKIRLSFTPRSGKRLANATTVRFRR